MLLNIILKTILRKEVKAMAVIYATLIVKGKKTINDVPPVIREQVKQGISITSEELENYFLRLTGGDNRA